MALFEDEKLEEQYRKVREAKRLEEQAYILKANASLMSESSYRGVKYGTTQYSTIVVLGLEYTTKPAPIELTGSVYTNKTILHKTIDDLISAKKLTEVVDD